MYRRSIGDGKVKKQTIINLSSISSIQYVAASSAVRDMDMLLYIWDR